MRKLLIRLIKSSRFLNSKIYNQGFITKFNLRQYFFNRIVNFLAGKEQGVYNCAHFTSRIVAANNLVLEGNQIGTYTSLVVSGGCYIQAGNGISIGEGTIWAPNVALISANHNMNHEKNAWLVGDGITIGKNCWIGTNVTVLPGVTIGNNCTIAAGAVVTKSFLQDNITLAGVPARVIKSSS